NGSGKTTFFRTVAGLLAPLAGRSNWSSTAGHPNRDLFYYETSEWFEGNLSGLDYLRFVKQTWQSSVDIDQVIAYWEMEDYIHLPIRQYSLGMKQRVLIAMYMV
ncbi:ATP-binding cassette domain-containing protein, partial [Streptococcus suis]